jgi:Flp pilus assembly pilin Flp
MLRDTEGLTTVEYLIILSVVAILGIAAWNTFGDTVSEQVGEGTQTIDNLSMEPGGGSGNSGSSSGATTAQGGNFPGRGQ